MLKILIVMVVIAIIPTDDLQNFNISIFSIVDYMLWTCSWWFTSDKSLLKWWMTDTINLQYSASWFQFGDAIVTTQCGQTMYLHINKLRRTAYKWREYWVYFERSDFQKKETGRERYCINWDSKARRGCTRYLRQWWLTDFPRFFTLSFLDVIKSNSLPYSSFSMLLNVCTTPDFVSTSKSNDLHPVLQDKFFYMYVNYTQHTTRTNFHNRKLYLH